MNSTQPSTLISHPKTKTHPQIKVRFVDLGQQYISLRDEILEQFDSISQRGDYILSPHLKDFESNFAQYCDAKFAVGVANGGDALFLSLHALDIKAGDEVITAANSFVASAWAIANTGAKPVFADVREDYNIDPQSIRRQITSRTKAIMPVHLTGRPAEMDEILKLAKDFNLLVIEDAAQAVGASYKGRKVGSLGNTGCFSLHPLKNLHVHGDGGVITTNDNGLYEKLLLLRNHGLKNRDECVLWGFNSRLDSIQAAIANIKLRHLETWNSRFRAIAERYSENLKHWVGVPVPEPFEICTYHRYIITTERRDELQEYLLNRGIETKVNYPIPLHLQEVSRRELNHQEGDFPVTERLATRILSLPIYAELKDDQIDYVIREVQAFFK